MKVDVAEVRQVAMSCCVSLLSCLATAKILDPCQASGAFQSDREQPVWSLVDSEDWPEYIQDAMSLIFEHSDDVWHSLYDLIVPLVNETSVSSILDRLGKVCLFCCHERPRWKTSEEFVCLPICSKEGNQFELQVLENNRLKLTWTDGDPKRDILPAVEDMLNDIRNNARAPTVDQYFVTHLAYQYIRRGRRTTTNEACPLGNPGFHSHTQTYMSLTNSGEGHVQGTTRRADWMRGVLVHVEYIERPRRVSGSVEAYRIPSCYDVAQVRLHVGTAASTTCYVGRPSTDPRNLEYDFVTEVNCLVSIVNHFFSLGVAECKISMFRLSTSQALRLMKAVGGQVQKTPHQVLSAAWNLKQELKVDHDCRASGQKYLKHPVDIALKAVEVTSVGGFQKVTWDGSGNTCPSICVLQLLSHQEALTIVHEAHEHGLLTYFSAGFGLGEIPLAVHTGVDGIGIGGVLHPVDPCTGIRGPYKSEDIPKVLEARDKAAAGLMGQAAHLLARLDTMFVEGSISTKENRLRKQLFEVLKTEDEPKIEGLMGELKHISSMKTEGSKPFLACAERLINAEKPMLRQSCSHEEWTELKDVLEQLEENGEESKAMTKYNSEIWMRRREAWKSHLGGNKNLPSCKSLSLRESRKM